MKSFEVVGMGAMNLDQLFRVDQILVDGEAPVKGFSYYPGGSAANTVCGLAKLGVRTGFVGAVGGDEAGRALIDDLVKCGVDVSQIRVKKAVKTGSTICLADQRGRRSLYVMPGANSLLAPDDVDLAYAHRAAVIHLSSFLDDLQFELQRKIVAELSNDVRISFAPGAVYASKGMRQLIPFLERTHVLFLNRSEMKLLTGDDFAEGARKCLDLGCQTVVTTLGLSRIRPGAGGREAVVAGHILSLEGEYLVESRARKGEPVVGTLGAGDAFAAGFLYGLVKDKELPQCGLLAEIMARFCVARMGAREGLPSLAELSERYYLESGERL